MIRPRPRLVPLELLLFGLLALGVCAKRPPDTDATPPGANALALDTPRRDSLDCGKDDCADWFRVDVPSKGRLVTDLSAEAPAGEDVRISISLADANGATLARDQTIGRAAISVSAEVVPGTYLIAIASNHPSARFEYSVTPRLLLPPPPPPKPVALPIKRNPAPVKPPPPAPPRFETKRAEVLEVHENGPHGRAVLLDAGASQGLRVGLRGRLLEGGRAIGTLEIVEVYPEGCLASVEGTGSNAIGTAGVAEIDIPIASPPRP